jgi:hypothetical protein
MDHRWDERIRQDRDGRAERERYGAARIEHDESVERRDRRIAKEQAERARTVNFSPWEIGARHWDQRDLYTRDARIEDSGYARGPAVHPEVGSYAYHRDEEAPPSSRRFGDDDGPSIYEREAWPMLNYLDTRPRGESEHNEGLWSRVKHALHIGGHHGKGPKNWNRSPARIREDVCEALAYHGELDATDIEVDVDGAEVTLKGTVPDRHSKRLAERIVEGVYGVDDVHNRLKVRRHDDTNDTNVAFVMPARSFA